MPLKLLIDLGVGKRLEEFLRRNGYDISAVRDIDPRMEDSQILRIAESEQRIVVTMDKDFGELIYNAKQAHTGVLLLRMEDARAEEKIRIVAMILKEHSDKLQNHFCVYQDGRIRIR